MILEVGPGAPFIAKAAAEALLVTHIGGGALGMISGGVAILARKGGRLHRRAGNLFFVSMLAMAGVGAGVAPFLPAEQLTNTTAAVFTLYLVASAWATVKRRPGEVGRFERWAVLAPLAIAAVGLMALVPGLKPHEPTAGAIYPIAMIAGFAAACDLIMLRRGGIAGPPRVARHLWRMGLGLFIATGSFFFGQQDRIPEALHGPLLSVPPFAALGLTLFWLVRTRWPKRPRRPKPFAAPA